MSKVVSVFIDETGDFSTDNKLNSIGCFVTDKNDRELTEILNKVLKNAGVSFTAADRLHATELKSKDFETYDSIRTEMLKESFFTAIIYNSERERTTDHQVRYLFILFKGILNLINHLILNDKIDFKEDVLNIVVGLRPVNDKNVSFVQYYRRMSEYLKDMIFEHLNRLKFSGLPKTCVKIHFRNDKEEVGLKISDFLLSIYRDEIKEETNLIYQEIELKRVMFEDERVIVLNYFFENRLYYAFFNEYFMRGGEESKKLFANLYDKFKRKIVKETEDSIKNMFARIMAAAEKRNDKKYLESAIKLIDEMRDEKLISMEAAVRSFDEYERQLKNKMSVL